MNRNVPSNSARYLRAFMFPPSLTLGWARQRYRRCPRRANQQCIAPRPAQDLDELQPVDRLGRVAPDGERAVAFEQDGRRERLGRSRSEAAAIAIGQLPAAGHPERQERQAGQEQGGLGQGRRIRDLAGQRQRHRRGQVGVGHRPDVGPRRVDREVDRQVRRRAAPAARDRLTVRVIEPDDDEVVGRRARPCAGRSASRAGGPHPGGRTCCPRRRRSAPAPRVVAPRGSVLGRGRRGVHAPIVRARAGRVDGPRAAVTAAGAPPVPSADAPEPPRAAACPEPRLQGPADRARASRRSATRSASRRCRCSSWP